MEFFMAIGEGKSLWPLVKPRSLVLWRKTPFSSLRRGDLVLFSWREETICHQIIWKKRLNGKYSYLLKGNHFTNDGWVSEERVLGKVYEIDGGSLSRFDKILKLQLFWLFSSLQLFMSPTHKVRPA